MEINYLAVLVCAVLSMVLGSLWYGPLFGKQWMAIMGVDITTMTKEKQKEMQKEMWPMYVLQLVLSFVQIGILSYYISIGTWIDVSPVSNTLLIWLGFMVPLIAGNAMWNSNPTKTKWMQFGIQAGYNLVTMVLFALILSAWI